jgi:signal transduction histidine kinase
MRVGVRALLVYSVFSILSSGFLLMEAWRTKSALTLVTDTENRTTALKEEATSSILDGVLSTISTTFTFLPLLLAVGAVVVTGVFIWERRREHRHRPPAADEFEDDPGDEPTQGDSDEEEEDPAEVNARLLSRMSRERLLRDLITDDDNTDPALTPISEEVIEGGLTEDLTDDETPAGPAKSAEGDSESSLPAFLLGEGDNPEALAGSYDRMVDALRKVNELEKEYRLELAMVNDQLQKEIAERKRAEEESRTLSRRLIDGMEEARKVLARDLHDEFGQTLTALHMEMDGLAKSMPDGLPNQRKRIDALITLVEQLGEKIRNISSELRPDLLDDMGLVPTLEWNVKEFVKQHPNIRVDFQAVGLRKRLPAEIETTLFRIFQEGMNNVVKHANAGVVKVNLTYSHPKVILIVIDNGDGFQQPVTSGGIGLLGMRERVEAVKGEIDIRSIVGKGTRIRVELPVT